MRVKLNRLLIHEWGHPNLRLDKAAKFWAAYGVMYPLGLLMLWLLTEKAGLWYIYSSLISGGTVAALRFVTSALVFGAKGAN